MSATYAADEAQTRSQRLWQSVVAALTGLLRMYAGCFFSSSLAVGALILAASLLVPWSGLYGVLGVCSAALTARALGLTSEQSPPSVYAYSALFIGIGARSTFATPAAALALATLGAAVSAPITAGIRGFFVRVGLPSLSLPFVLVYWCTISVGRTLGVAWAVPAHSELPSYLAFMPPSIQLFFQALGAILFNPRVDVGVLVFAAFCATGLHAPLLALLAFAITMLADWGFAFDPSLRFAALLNAIFTAVGLGIGWYTPSPMAYLRAGAGALLCALLTLGLAEPLGRLDLIPLSLPFNLSVYAVLLVSRQRAFLQRPNTTLQHFAPAREPAQTDSVGN
jgi:urea transporter